MNEFRSVHFGSYNTRIEHKKTKACGYSFVTARKRSLGQGNMFTGVCLSTGGVCMVPGGAWSLGGSMVPEGCMVLGEGMHGPGGCMVLGGAW